MEGNDQQAQSDQKPVQTVAPIESTVQEEIKTERKKSSRTKIVEWLNRNHKSANVVINFLLMVVTGLLFWKATVQSEAAQDAIKEYQREFNINHRAQLEIVKSEITRDWWFKNGKDTIQERYYFVNNYEYPVVINSIKHKWSFDPAEIKKYIGYLEQNTLDSINFDNIQGLEIGHPLHNFWLRKGGDSGEAIIRNHYNNSVSENLKKNNNLLFSEIFYTNVYTREKFKYLFIGELYGRLEVHSNIGSNIYQSIELIADGESTKAQVSNNR
jgi:hypothetical protein